MAESMRPDALSITLFVSFLLLIGILPLVALLPYDAVKCRVDAWGRDGGADFFTPAFYRDATLVLRLTGVVMLLAALAFRRRIMRYFAELRRSAFILAGDMIHLIRTVAKERVEFYALLALTATAAIIRALYLNHPMRYDEAAGFLLYSSEPLRFALTNYAGPGNHLFYTLLSHLSYVVMGNEPWIIRLPAFLSGILLVPLSYVVIRLIYGSRAALMAAALVATSAVLIGYSTNARGYSIIWLLFMLLIGLALYLKRKDNRAAWILFSTASALGVYTIPIMLYPIGIVSVWLALSLLYRDVAWSRAVFVKKLLQYSLCTAVISLALYSPVFAVSGYRSVFANEWVLPLPAAKFLRTLPGSMYESWSYWHRDVPAVLAGTFILGFFVSLAFHRKLTEQRVHIMAAVVLFFLPALTVHRVIPPPRVVSFMLPLYLGFVAAGLCYAVKQIPGNRLEERPLLFRGGVALLLCTLALSVFDKHGSHRNEYATYSDGEKAALFLKDYLREKDRVLVFGPVNMPLWYYFHKFGIPDSVLFRRLGDSERLILIENYPTTGPVETLEGTLEKGKVDSAAFSCPRLVTRFEFSSLYELMRRVQ